MYTNRIKIYVTLLLVVGFFLLREDEIGFVGIPRMKTNGWCSAEHFRTS